MSEVVIVLDYPIRKVFTMSKFDESLCFTLSRSSSQVPRLKLPEELFVNVGMVVGSEVNKALGFLQDVALSRDLKQFLVVRILIFPPPHISRKLNFVSVFQRQKLHLTSLF